MLINKSIYLDLDLKINTKKKKKIKINKYIYYWFNHLLNLIYFKFNIPQ